MTRELIKEFAEIVKPFVQKRLLEDNFEGMGEQDKAEFGRDFDEIISLAIKGLESSTWIPVTERLPKKGKQVLCCNKYGSVFTSCITYRESGSGSAYFGQHYDVIAWMPLPQPYRGESEG